MSDIRNLATYVLAISFFSLAAALVYFTVVLARVANQLPVIFSSVEQTSKTIEPVIKEIGEIRSDSTCVAGVLFFKF